MTSWELRARLRLWRTLLVYRWHAAQTLGEALGRRFKHINHARSLGQYVWLHGAFREADNGGGRVLVDGPGLCKIIEPLTLHGRHGRLDQLYQIARRPAVGERSADQQQHVRKTLAAGRFIALASVFVWGWNTSSPERRAAYEEEAEWSKTAWVTLYDMGGVVREGARLSARAGKLSLSQDRLRAALPSLPPLERSSPIGFGEC